MPVVLPGPVELRDVIQDHHVGLVVVYLLGKVALHAGELHLAVLGADQRIVLALPWHQHEIVREGVERDLMVPRDLRLPPPQLVVIVLAGPHEHLERARDVVHEPLAKRKRRADLLRDQRFPDAAGAHKQRRVPVAEPAVDRPAPRRRLPRREVGPVERPRGGGPDLGNNGSLRALGRGTRREPVIACVVEFAPHGASSWSRACREDS
jgi:hypothetical protein